MILFSWENIIEADLQDTVMVIFTDLKEKKVNITDEEKEVIASQSVIANIN